MSNKMSLLEYWISNPITIIVHPIHLPAANLLASFLTVDEIRNESSSFLFEDPRDVSKASGVEIPEDFFQSYDSEISFENTTLLFIDNIDRFHALDIKPPEESHLVIFVTYGFNSIPYDQAPMLELHMTRPDPLLHFETFPVEPKKAIQVLSTLYVLADGSAVVYSETPLPSYFTEVTDGTNPKIIDNLTHLLFYDCPTFEVYLKLLKFYHRNPLIVNFLIQNDQQKESYNKLLDRIEESDTFFNNIKSKTKYVLFEQGTFVVTGRRK